MEVYFPNHSSSSILYIEWSVQQILCPVLDILFQERLQEIETNFRMGN